VNPVVAIVLGHFAAGEIITGRSIAASALILVSVFLLLSGGAPIKRNEMIKAGEEVQSVKFMDVSVRGAPARRSGD
jgi:hypothetical protein